MAALNQLAVDRRIERLRDEHGDASVRERRVELPPERFEGLVDDVREGYVGGAYAGVVREPGEGVPLSESMPPSTAQDRDRVLLILHRGRDRWTAPGGGVEGDETFAEAAVREVREETGIDCRATDLASVWRNVAASAGSDDREVHYLAAVFDGRYEGGTLDVQAGELNGAAWFSRPPERVSERVEALADRWWDDASEA